MKKPIHERALSGSLAGGVATAATMAMQIVQVPLLLHVWGKDQYGTWVSVFAALSLITALDLGHQTYVGNELNRFHVADRQRFRCTLASAMLVAAVVGLAELGFFGFIASSGLIWKWAGPKHLAPQAAFIWPLLILLVNSVLLENPVFVVCRTWISKGFFARSQLWCVAWRLAQFSGAMVVALLGGTLLGASGGWVIGGLLLLLFFLQDLRKTTAEFYPWWHGGNLRTGFGNWFRSIWVTSNGILDQLSLNGLALLVAQGAGVAAVPAFTTVRTLANIATTGAGVFLAPIQVDLVRFHVNREHEKIGQIFSVAWFGLGILINSILLITFPLIDSVFRIWTRGALPFDFLLFVTLGLSVALRGLGAPMQNYLISINQLKAQSWCSAMRAVLTLGGAFLLLSRWGLPGVGVAVAVGELVGTLILSTWFVAVEFRNEGFGFPWGQLALASMSLLSMALTLAGAAHSPTRRWLFAAVGLATTSLLARWQWYGLSSEVRGRFRLIVLRFVPGFC